MLNKIKGVKIEQEDGTLSDTIPIGVEVENVGTPGGSLDKDLKTIKSDIEVNKNGIKNLEGSIKGLASGSPLVANSIAGMTDKTRVYVNTTDGHWYYYDGSKWTDGGVYQATEVEDNSITFNKLSNEFKKQTNNLLNIAEKQVGYTIATYSSSSINSPGVVKSNFILYPVIRIDNKGTYIGLDNNGNGVDINAMATYDINGKYIKYLEVQRNTIITFDNDVYYIRFASKNTNLITQFKRTDIENYTPNYEPYGYTPLLVFKKDIEDLSKIKTIEETFSINIGNLLKKIAFTPVITWIDDDCDFNGIEKVKNICDKLNIKATFACVTSGISSTNQDIENAGLNNIELKNRLLQYQENGFHITTHSNHHAKIWKTTDASYNVRECEKDLIKSLQMLKENGFLDSDFLVTPFGTHNTAIRNIAEKWCKCLINAGTGVNHLFGNGQYNINRIFINSANELSYYTKYIDDAYENGDWIIFGTHSGTESEFSEDLVTQVLQYAINKNITIKPLNQVWKTKKFLYDINSIFN